jgi:hypothetical protein
LELEGFNASRLQGTIGTTPLTLSPTNLHATVDPTSYTLDLSVGVRACESCSYLELIFRNIPEGTFGGKNRKVAMKQRRIFFSGKWMKREGDLMPVGSGRGRGRENYTSRNVTGIKSSY